ncbi:MAG TPA: hypothetical protein VFA37_02810 [Gaiellaceae bacterium]|nr:hypothetical protein [Gaiellaceae bacterium]
MKKVLLVGLAAAAASLVAAGSASSNPDWAGQCGIASQETVWAEYGWPTLLPILARPGTLLAVTNNPHSDYPAQARARGAATYEFQVHMKDKVGTPQAPADPSTIAAAAQTEYDNAVSHTGGCQTPLIVENELFGANNVPPWIPSTVQYRADVLAFFQDLAALGAHPVLLVSRAPFTGTSDAVAWWLDIAKVASIVREDYVPAPAIWKLGPVLGNRQLREDYRQAVADFTSIGIPPSRLGIMISVLTGKGGGGRNELEPASAWYQVVKWYALSAKQVARELGLGSVFSWGWQQWNPKEVDPTKREAACVWLWTRDKSLCNAPRLLGKGFDTSLTEGQIILRRGTQCRVPGLGSISETDAARLTLVTGDRNAALSALLERLVESSRAAVKQHDVLAAERTVVRESFGGSTAAYHAALAQAHATVSEARAVLADELRAARLEASLPVRTPTAAEVAAFYSDYPDLSVRSVSVKPKAPWLGGRNRGLALSGAAPAELFSAASGRKAKITTLAGTYTVEPAGAAIPLAALSISAARPAIVAALEGFERTQALERWMESLQRQALETAICRADELPQPGNVDLTQYLPFLQLQ